MIILHRLIVLEIKHHWNYFEMYRKAPEYQFRNSQ